MAFPNRIIKDTSARKGPTPLAPHDAALQAYMHTLINSIHDSAALATHARHAKHEQNFHALKVCFIESYNDAVRKLNKKCADDLTKLNAERDAKVADLRKEFANDPLGTIMKQQNVATGKSAQGSVTVQQQASQTSLPVDAEAAVPRAAATKQEPVEEATQPAPTSAILQGVSTATPATEAARTSCTTQSVRVPCEIKSAGAIAMPSSEAQQQNDGCAEVGIASGSGNEAGQGCQDLVEVKTEVIKAGLENGRGKADSVIASSDDQTRKTAPLGVYSSTDDTSDRPTSSLYVDLTAA